MSIDPAQYWVYLLVAFFLPPIIAIVKQAGLSTQINALIAQAIYIIAGIAAAIWSGIPVNAENAIPLIAIATVVGSAAYKLFWSNLGKATDTDLGLDERLTTATSVVKAKPVTEPTG